MSHNAGKDGSRAEEFKSLSFSPSLVCKQHYLSLMHYQETEREKMHHLKNVAEIWIMTMIEIRLKCTSV